MKHLQRIFFLFVLSVAVFSCQKEYSVENGGVFTVTSAQWEFKESGIQFKGPIDTAAIDTLGGYAFLNVTGHSDDNTSQISLQVFGLALKTGTYKTPFSLFAYLKNGSIVYQSDQTLTDSFSIVISKFDTTGVTGTFSGRVLLGNTANTTRVVDGKFSAVFKSKSTVTPPASTDSGQVVLWSKAGCGGGTSTSPITVSVGGKSGQVTQFFTAEPTTCDPAGAFSVKLPAGTYPVVTKCGTDSIAGYVTVVKNTCTKLQVDFTTPITTSGDYFPMTTNSNWSYAYDGGAAGDTLYTLSTGVPKSMLSQTYNMFTDKDATGKDSAYYRKSGSVYYQYVPASAYTDSTTNITITSPAYEYKFLVSNLPAGAAFSSGPFTSTASSGGVSAPIAVTLNSTILAVGASATIGALPYTNIIKIRTVYSYTAGTTTTNFYASEQWFAPGVGSIKYIDYFTDPFTTPDDILNLTRAKVN